MAETFVSIFEQETLDQKQEIQLSNCLRCSGRAVEDTESGTWSARQEASILLSCSGTRGPFMPSSFDSGWLLHQVRSDRNFAPQRVFPLDKDS